MKRLLLTLFLFVPLFSFADVNIGFSPNGGAEELVLSTIDHAKKSINMAAFSFTNRRIATALVHAQKRGVQVQIVADKKVNQHRSVIMDYLSRSQVAVRLNGNYAIMHNKFMVIDGDTVETGSFNYTYAAARRNAENVIVINNSTELANRYLEQWNRLWNEGSPYQ